MLYVLNFGEGTVSKYKHTLKVKWVKVTQVKLKTKSKLRGD